MGAEIKVFSAVTLTIDGTPYKPIGSIAVSVKGAAASIDSGRNPITRVVKIPSGEVVTPWLWADTEGFSYLEVRPWRPDGGEADLFVQVAVRYNAPTSTTDLTPTGSINHWKEFSKSCVAVFALDTERAYIHATAASETDQSNGGTYPKLWDQVDKVLGVADALALFNEDDEEDQYVEITVIPK